MKALLATLVERKREGGCVHMTGKLGDCAVILERAGRTKTGKPVWRLMLATDDQPRREGGRAAHNRAGASWRIRQRQAEGVEELGGMD